MPTSFEFATAGRIIFGAGTVNQLAASTLAFGCHAFVVVGRDVRRAEGPIELLRGAGCAATTYSVAGEPTTDAVEQGVRLAREAGCDVVIGFGGGSALDAAKAIAALLTNTAAIMDYLEVIGRAQPLTNASVPCIAVPTTAGTGSEVTRNAVLASPAHRVKVSLRSPHMLPRVAIVDPELTYSLNAEVTATTGLDALTQLLEPYVCSRANPLTDGVCVEGLGRAARSLRHAVENGRDVSAREDMAVASLLGGLALANAGLGAVHGFAGPIGGAFSASHGAICAALLPVVTAGNLRALRARAPQSAALERYEHAARIVTGRPQAMADDLVGWLRTLVEQLRIPSLKTYGIGDADIPGLVASASKASSMKANPIALTADECNEILREAL